MFDSLLTSPFSSRALTTEVTSNVLERVGLSSSLLPRLGLNDRSSWLARSMARAIGDEAKQVVKQFSGRLPFADGQLKLDLSTGLGKIEGTIEFGNGALVSNLTTPFGPYFSSIDFKEQDQIKFQAGQLAGVLNFNDGLVIVDLQPQAPGGEIAFPINALSGDIELKNGQAIVNTDAFGPIAKFDLSALAQRTVTNAFTESIKSRVLGSSTTPTNAIARQFDLSALLT